MARENLHAFSVKLHSVLPLQSNSSDQYSLHRASKSLVLFILKTITLPLSKLTLVKSAAKQFSPEQFMPPNGVQT